MAYVEIKKFYPTEYEIGIRALDWIDESVAVKLPIDEVPAIHLPTQNIIIWRITTK